MGTMTGRDITLDFAYAGDAAKLALMSRDLIETGLGWGYRAQRIAALIADPEVAALVAREGTRTVGFALMSFRDERAHLVLLAVQPRYRRRGIARRMITWLMESAAIAGIASIHVELRANNVAAHALYRALGFAETLRVTGYYRGRETAVRMVRMMRTGSTEAGSPAADSRRQS